MTKIEFAKVIAFIGSATNQSTEETRVEVFFELLGDLPASVFQAAAKKVVLNHKWATFPSVAELREACVEIMQGNVARLSSGEAWDLAWKSVGRIDPEQSHTLAILDKLPPLVSRAISCFGLPALCYGKEPIGVVRGQFMKIYEQLDTTDKQRALLPGKLVEQIEERSSAILALTASIGKIDP